MTFIPDNSDLTFTTEGNVPAEVVDEFRTCDFESYDSFDLFAGRGVRRVAYTATMSEDGTTVVVTAND